MVLGFVLGAAGPSTSPAMAADGLTMEARILLNGNARIGSWMAIEVHLVNAGPAVIGELRLAGGSQGQTRFGRVVDLPTQSDKTYLMYAQPPAFGSELEIVLAADEQKVASTKAKFSIHDVNQLVVAVVAERPEGIVGNLRLLPNQNQVAPLVMTIAPEDLPERVEAWNMLDRLVWQDLDAGRLTLAQLDALRGWVAGGGRLVIVGGTSGPRSLAAFPDVLLPYRPTATIDVPPAALSGLMGELPAAAADLPALSGELVDGRALAVVGDRVVAAERSYGTGVVTLLGFDPTTDWIGDETAGVGMWRRLLPPRSSGNLVFSDDNMLVSAVSQLPSLALPPIGGLVALLGAYIVLIGPLNYLVLRRLDRREWAWVTMPILIVAVHGRLRTASGPCCVATRSSSMRSRSSGAHPAPRTVRARSMWASSLLLAASTSSAFRAAPSCPHRSVTFSAARAAATQLDLLQGDPSRVRNLAVGFGSLRTIRAETLGHGAADRDRSAPRGRPSCRGRSPTCHRRSSSGRRSCSAVPSRSWWTWRPGPWPPSTCGWRTCCSGSHCRTRSSAPIFFGDGRINSDTVALNIRHSMVDQLTWDPNFGSTGQLPTRVRSSWPGARANCSTSRSRVRSLADSGTCCITCRLGWSIHGATTFQSDLIRSSVIDTDAAFFSKDPVQHQLWTRLRDRSPTGRPRSKGRWPRTGDRDRPQLRRRSHPQREADPGGTARRRCHRAAPIRPPRNAARRPSMASRR